MTVRVCTRREVDGLVHAARREDTEKLVEVRIALEDEVSECDDRVRVRERYISEEVPLGQPCPKTLQATWMYQL